MHRCIKTDAYTLGEQARPPRLSSTSNLNSQQLVEAEAMQTIVEQPQPSTSMRVFAVGGTQRSVETVQRPLNATEMSADIVNLDANALQSPVSLIALLASFICTFH